MRPDDAAPKYWKPSGLTIWAIFLGGTLLVVVAFFAGYIPLEKRRTVIAAEAREEQHALPRVETIVVARSTRSNGLVLPGSIQPITEAAILARANGYVQ